MASVVKTYTVITKGKGAPDYSDTVSSAKERRGLRLEYGQYLKMFGRSLNLGGDIEYPLVPSTPLAVGANTHLVDFETLASMPYIVPIGYTATIITISYTLSQDAQVYAYVDGGLVNVSCLAAIAGGRAIYENKILGLSTDWFDPAGLASHIIDIKLYNLGAADLFGAIGIDAILKEVGTPPLPSTKECHCPYCGNKQVESEHATRIKCSSCGKEYVVFDLTGFRETP